MSSCKLFSYEHFKFFQDFESFYERTEGIILFDAQDLRFRGYKACKLLQH